MTDKTEIVPGTPLDRALAKAEDFCRQQAEECEERLARWAREDAEAKREVDALGRV